MFGYRSARVSKQASAKQSIRRAAASALPARVEMLEDRRLFAAGDFDPSFGADGVVSLPSGSDFRVRAGGKIDLSTAVNGHAGIEQLNPDGTPDATFGTKGIVDLGGGTGAVVLFQSNGTFLAQKLDANNAVTGLVRFNADGTLDQSFGTGGVASVSGLAPREVPVQTADGKYLFQVAPAANDKYSAFSLKRLNGDGSVDTSYGTNGVRAFSLGIQPVVNSDGSREVNDALSLTTGGKILFEGQIADANKSGAFVTAIARFNLDGSLDTSFGGAGTGRATLAFPGNVNVVPGDSGIHLDVVTASDGTLFGTGSVATPGAPNFSEEVVFRLNADGTPDTAYGNGSGFAVLNADGTPTFALTVDSQERAYVSLQSSAIVRLTAAGAPDPTFGFNGQASTRLPDPKLGVDYFVPTELVIEPDGKLLGSGDGTGVIYQPGNPYNGRGVFVRLLTAGPESVPPTASLPAAPDVTTGRPNVTVNVTYADNAAIKVASLPGSTITVTGPNGYAGTGVVQPLATGQTLNGTPRTVTYLLTPPAADGWDATADGVYTVKTGTGVADTSGNPLAGGTTLGTFKVNISPAVGTISGYAAVFADGTAAKSSPLNNGIVYLDANHNGQLDASEVRVTSNLGNGLYQFNNVAPGTYDVRLVTPAADPYYVTPASKLYTATVTAGHNVLHQSFDVSPVAPPPPPPPPPPPSPYGKIDGYVTMANGNGAGNVEVYLDLNHNGEFDPATEPVAGTNTDTGFYQFINVAPGTYDVRLSLPASEVPANPASGVLTVSVAAGQDVSHESFTLKAAPPPPADPATLAGYVTIFPDGVDNKGAISGSGTLVFLDANHDGVPDFGETRVRADASGFYTFKNLAAGSYDVRIVPPTSYRALTPSAGHYEVTVAAGQELDHESFDLVNATVVPAGQGGAIRGTVLNYPDAVDSAGSTPLANVVVYLDANHNGAQDAGETAVKTDANGNFLFASVAPATYDVRIGATAREFAPSSGFFTATVVQGQTVTAGTFAVSSNSPGYLQGRVSVYPDGKDSAGSSPLYGVTVYVDENGNGTFDAGEPSAISGSNGTYSLYGPVGKAYALRVVLPSGYAGVVTPAAGYYTFDFPAGQSNSLFGQDFGLAPTSTPPSTASVSGYVTVYPDGKDPAGSYVRPNTTVYLDANHDGVLDDNEVSVLTGSNGLYTIGGLAAGTYDVRIVLPPAYNRVIYPSGGTYTANLAAGQSLQHVSFDITNAPA